MFSDDVRFRRQEAPMQYRDMPCRRRKMPPNERNSRLSRASFWPIFGLTCSQQWDLHVHVLCVRIDGQLVPSFLSDIHSTYPPATTSDARDAPITQFTVVVLSSPNTHTPHFYIGVFVDFFPFFWCAMTPILAHFPHKMFPECTLFMTPRGAVPVKNAKCRHRWSAPTNAFHALPGSLDGMFLLHLV